MKIKKIINSRAFRALELPLGGTFGYLFVSVIFGNEVGIFEILPYYLAMMFIAWAVRYIWLRGEEDIFGCGGRVK